MNSLRLVLPFFFFSPQSPVSAMTGRLLLGLLVLTTRIITAVSTYMNQIMSLLDATNTFYHAMFMSYSLNALTPAKTQTTGFLPECL